MTPKASRHHERTRGRRNEARPGAVRGCRLEARPAALRGNTLSVSDVDRAHSASFEVLMPATVAEHP